MSKDSQINVRLSKKTNSELKKIALLKKTTPSILINDVIDDIITGKATNKDTKIQVLENEIEELKNRFEKEFDKKIPKTHRVSIGLTDEEFLKIKQLSSKSSISKSKVLRNILQNQKQNIKSLT